MTDYNITIIVLFIVAAAMVITFAQCVISGDKDALIALIFAVLFGTVGFVLLAHHDSRVVSRADNFFKTRDGAYSCELPDGYACKLKLKEWREDSIYWTEKVKGVLEE
jgi:hypothetical protein